MAETQPDITMNSQPQLPSPDSAPAPAALISNRVFESLMYKNHLQEYTQRSSLPLPIYQTPNEGSQHEPKFRSTVLVDGSTYTSNSTFSRQKVAEQDVARLALECITKKIKDEGCPLIYEDTVFCKSILNEYVVKMNLARPTYSTIQSEAVLPRFVSTMVFNGVAYTGDAGKTKKEAEQLAARAVILSILGNPGSGRVLYEIINSKGKWFTSVLNVKDSQKANHGFVPVGVNTVMHNGNHTGVGFTNTVAVSATPESTSRMILPHHEYKRPKPEEPASEAIDLPIAFVPPCSGQSLGGDDPNPAKKRRKKKMKRKANKKLRTDAQSPIAAVTLGQAPSCSVAQ
ncbi:dsrm domain-containing protein [Cephalotus follicularis]|uniref:Dsrm domain-containing protein n=1 Tax=Cephalotus follicularis TaxID=3775 RepID=A0A1Q3BZE1_CEPFO|nr:dsrm domain-containing protein [Cephalotus follicularis]